MQQGKGFTVCKGIAIGKPFVYQRTKRENVICAGTPFEEQQLVNQAIQTATEQLHRLFEQTKRSLGEEHAAIIEVQLLMLQDADFLEEISKQINKGNGAVQAVESAGKIMSDFFSGLDDDYMKERAVDVLDLATRLTDILTQSQVPDFPREHCIVVAEDLSPSETVTFPRERILGFITQKGSPSGHTAILAKTLNIPSLIQADINLAQINEQSTMAVDGKHGRWYINPTKEVMELLLQNKEKEELQKEKLKRYQGKTVIANGRQIYMCANIGSVGDALAAGKGDTDGIGLLRSEFLYLGKSKPPTEEEQTEVYTKIAKIMKEKMVIIRTLDIGADKQVDFLPQVKEENPALGIRGIRLCLENTELFKTQLRAIYRASVYGNLHLMFPMISSLWEIKKAKEICEHVRNRLVTEGYCVKPIPIGVMIETPAAALCSGALAREVDFFSVGTNDLLQYVMAADRQNPKVAEYCNPNHPAFLKLLGYVAKNAHKAGIWAGVCGELASHPHIVNELIQMGYTELSMPLGKILETKKIIIERDV